LHPQATLRPSPFGTNEKTNSGTGALAFALGLIVDYAKKPSPESQEGATVIMVTVICAIFTLVCYGIAGWSWWTKKTQIDNIVAGTKPGEK